MIGKAIENKWIFKKETNADGNVAVYKARLVAKGFRQVQGVDYDEIFSLESCSDPTSNGQVSVLQCHPWIGNADTHNTRGFITK